MRLDQLPRSDKVEDRRGDGPGGFPMRAGGVGIGTIILLVIVGWALGINPLYLIGGAEILSGLRGSQEQSQPAPGSAKTEAPSDQMSEFVSAVLGSTEVQWKELANGTRCMVWPAKGPPTLRFPSRTGNGVNSQAWSPICTSGGGGSFEIRGSTPCKANARVQWFLARTFIARSNPEICRRRAMASAV
jgi:predicted metalloprotease